jgi:hypothetical protein
MLSRKGVADGWGKYMVNLLRTRGRGETRCPPALTFGFRIRSARNVMGMNRNKAKTHYGDVARLRFVCC